MNASMPLQLATWTSTGVSNAAGPQFMFDRGTVPNRLAGVSVVLETGGLARARMRLEAGASQVLLGDTALHQLALVRAAVEEFGRARTGVWVPARRAPVSWSLDSDSNCDFKCMVPSNPQARWDVLRADRLQAGLDVRRWVEKLLAQGVGTVLLAVDMQDDRDLDVCAGLVEEFGPALWFSPLDQPAGDFASWVEYGQVRRLVLPQGPGRAALARSLLEKFGPAAVAAGVAA